MTYSFANTPLKAAQAPLAAASGIHGIVVDVEDGGDGLGVGFWDSDASGIRGSASVSIMPVGEVGADDRWHWWRIRCRGGIDVVLCRAARRAFFVP